VVLRGRCDIAAAPTDAVVAITSSALCGSDLHAIEGRMPAEMSPAGRGPRGKQNTKSGRRSDLVVVGKVEEKCDCPACSGGELDPEQMLAELVDGAAGLAGCPLEAELAGALFVAMAVAGGDDTVPAFAQALIPAIEAHSLRTAMPSGATPPSISVGVSAARRSPGRILG
jgi:hypothetical protein